MNRLIKQTIQANDPRIKQGAKEIIAALRAEPGEAPIEPLLVVLTLRLAFTAYMSGLMKASVGSVDQLRQIVAEIPQMIVVPEPPPTPIRLTDQPH